MSDDTLLDQPLIGSNDTPDFAPPATPPATIAATANEVSFIGGVSQTGIVVSPSFSTWNSDTPDNGGSAPGGPAVYNTTSTAFKWGASATPGTPGGTITYAFNPASNWTATEQSVFVSSMALWSAVANVTFTLATSYATAALTFTRGNDKGAYETGTNNAPVPVGSATVGQTTTSAISIDTSVAGFGPIASVNTANGYPASTIVHELGHALGLGHGGPYNGTVNSATSQFSTYDTRLWSIMSYISPSDTGAKYYSSSPVTGTDWGAYQAPETPMTLDILALQRLYGLPVSTPLSGGQVFGFNSNITGTLAPYYNFVDNTTPVLTLWDAGTGNTLDLSGYTDPETVNLNPGTFSSVQGLVNDIGVAFNTIIDTAVGGGGDDTFYVNADADTINGMGGTNTVVFGGNQANYSLRNIGGTVTVQNTANNVTDTLMNISTLQFADGSVTASGIACYVHGTLIATPTGERPVQDLAIGDLVVTAAQAHRPIKWIGRRSYAGRFLLANAGVLPIRFCAGSLGDGLPRRDLLVSPEHAMFLDGLLIPARCLVDGSTIVQLTDRARVDYVHVELDSHDVILAEGAPSETFVDDDSRGMFHNGAEYQALYGSGQRPGVYCAERVVHGYALDATRRRLAGARMAA